MKNFALLKERYFKLFNFFVLLGERNIKKNDKKNFIILIKNRYYTAINLFLIKFYLNTRNLYRVNTFIKLLSLRGRYLFFVYF